MYLNPTIWSLGAIINTCHSDKTKLMGQTVYGPVCWSTYNSCIALSPEPPCEGLVHETTKYCIHTYFFI